jgi:phosphoenolpyruvate carboxykinase (ATP)
MFLRPELEELANFTPEWTLISLVSLADPATDGTRRNFAILDFTKKVALIGN